MKSKNIVKGLICVVATGLTLASVVACTQIANEVPNREPSTTLKLLEDYAKYEKSVRYCQKLGYSYSVSYDACVKP